MTINEGVTINESCANEARIFWSDLRSVPYGLLVNNKNRFSYSFMGAQKIGEHSLEQKAAVLVDDQTSKDQISTVLDLKKMVGLDEKIKVFEERDEAIQWLESDDIA